VQPRIRIGLGVLELDLVRAGAADRHLFVDLFKRLLEAIAQALTLDSRSSLTAPETQQVGTPLEGRPSHLGQTGGNQSVEQLTYTFDGAVFHLHLHPAHTAT
jgi:hypothetical protein